MVALVILFPQMVMVYKAARIDDRRHQDPDQLPPSDQERRPRARTGQPETQQQMQQEDKEQNKDAQSLEDCSRVRRPRRRRPAPRHHPSSDDAGRTRKEKPAIAGLFPAGAERDYFFAAPPAGSPWP